METAGIARDQYGTFEAEDTRASPFSRDIRRFTLPGKFNVPRFILYDGTSDPAAHLRHFVQRMSVWGDDDFLNCRVFSSSLRDLPLRWFCSLPKGSISSWRQLRISFLEKFQAHRVILKTDADLMALRISATGHRAAGAVGHVPRGHNERADGPGESVHLGGRRRGLRSRELRPHPEGCPQERQQVLQEGGLSQRPIP
ncbi:hypothetical protein MRB53_025912 [Persea americana]|uniref:Uncharacterized protein n=1 Tax=Persea americana TaxID=3435 RepID=A0ACC2LGJ6_PERAE|nr:hypothetical protein MRB53_025912 [Persea americana]